MGFVRRDTEVDSWGQQHDRGPALGTGGMVASLKKVKRAHAVQAGLFLDATSVGWLHGCRKIKRLYFVMGN